jgi:hypothetical protein
MDCHEEPFHEGALCYFKVAMTAQCQDCLTKAISTTSVQKLGHLELLCPQPEGKGAEDVPFPFCKMMPPQKDRQSIAIL